MQENPISLEKEVKRFIDFLNSDDFVTNPDLQTLNIQLVELYLAALKYGIENKKANPKMRAMPKMPVNLSILFFSSLDFVP